jgi:hypothetical protein
MELARLPEDRKILATPLGATSGTAAGGRDVRMPVRPAHIATSISRPNRRFPWTAAVSPSGVTISGDRVEANFSVRGRGRRLVHARSLVRRHPATVAALLAPAIAIARQLSRVGLRCPRLMHRCLAQRYWGDAGYA